MTIYLPALWVATGVCLFAALHFLAAGRADEPRRMYRAFGALCLSVAAYLAVSALMQIPGLGLAAGALERAHVAAACLVYPTAVWFFALYSRLSRPRPWVVAAILLFAALFVLNLLGPHGLLVAELRPRPPLILPWGERLREFGGRGTPLALLYYAATLAVFAWAFWRAWMLWRTRDRRRALPVTLYLVLQAMAIFETELANQFGLPQPQLDALPFLGLVIMLSRALTMELRQFAAELGQSNAALRDENAARRNAEAELRHIAYHDALTDLPNRRALDKRLRSLAAGIGNRKAAIIILDPQRFKVINQALGHDVGDEMMREIAARLKTAARRWESAFLTRLDGDEFAILLGGLPAGNREALATVRASMNSLREKLAQPMKAGQRGLHGEFHFGAAVFRETEARTEAVLRDGYMALQSAKSRDRDQLTVFSTRMRAAAERRLRLEQDLHSAIAQGSLHMEFQPQLDRAGAVIGAEGLLRWNHPRLGPIPAQEFIDIAEESGQIHGVGRHALRLACTVLASLPLEDLRFRLAVNLSPWQLFMPDFIETVESVLQETGADPNRLTLEITESVFVQDLADATAKIEALAALGVRFAIDDFGTGFASLASLKGLPANEVKIDQAFIHGMDMSQPDRFLTAIVALGHALGLEVVAEGVESDEQRDMLGRLGCDAFQGYLIAHPLNADRLRALLAMRL